MKVAPRTGPASSVMLFVRFGLVGILNTAFSYLLYAGLLLLGLGYAVANLIALLIGILFSFKTQGHLVFHNPDNRLLGRFAVGWLLVYLCNVMLIGRMIEWGLNAYYAGAVTLPVTVALSYFIQRYFVFRLRGKPSSASDQA